MTTPLRLGILGGGQIVRNVHLPTLLSLKDVTIRALAESDEVARNAIATKYSGVAMHADWREVIERDDVDAVLIALPNALHAASAVAAFEKRKHVYLEKPLGLDLFEAQEVLSEWRESGCVGAMGFNYRFNPLYQSLEAAIQSGRAGEIISLRTSFCTPLRKQPVWKRERESGGGVLLDLASHHIDLVRWMLECEVEEVYTHLRSVKIESDNAWIEMLMTNGVRVQSFFSMTSTDEDRIEVLGTQGKLSCERYSDLAPNWTPASGISRVGRWRQRAGHLLQPSHGARRVASKLRSPSHEPSYRIAFQTFVHSALTDRTYMPNLDDGYESLRVVLAAERAAESGMTVQLQGAETGSVI